VTSNKLVRVSAFTGSAWSLALNNAAVPNVNALSAEAFERLVGIATLALGAWREDKPAGFLLAFRPGTDYDCENYRWFGARMTDFLYIDRVVVGPAARRGGVGRALYEAAAAEAAKAGVPLTCEVNEEPPNPGSFAFHERLGFRVVGRQATEGGKKHVALMRRD
jgi:uncharacterized protein